MKILYAIQATGNGHISRARDIIPILQQKGELDILLSGTQADISLPYPVKYKLKGLSFVFGKKGGVDILETYRKARLKSFLKEINSLPVEDYDIIINDFEPVSAWAAFLKNKPCYALSHQAAVLSNDAPQPKKSDMLGKAILKRYAPSTFQFGFHFQRYNENIFTPVIRREVRGLNPVSGDHYTVYLPAYSEKRLIKILSAIRGVHWQVFSKHSKKPVTYKNVSVFPISNESFLKSMAGSQGVLCGAGFETPAEALFMGKNLLVIPMKGQFEQQCNAVALKAMGVPVLKKFRKKDIPKIEEWISSGKKVAVDYPDQTENIIGLLFEQYENDLRAFRSASIFENEKSLARSSAKAAYHLRNFTGFQSQKYL